MKEKDARKKLRWVLLWATSSWNEAVSPGGRRVKREGRKKEKEKVLGINWAELRGEQAVATVAAIVWIICERSMLRGTWYTERFVVGYKYRSWEPYVSEGEERGRASIHTLLKNNSSHTLTCLLPPSFTMAIMMFSDAMKGNSWLMWRSITWRVTTRTLNLD